MNNYQKFETISGKNPQKVVPILTFILHCTFIS